MNAKRYLAASAAVFVVAEILEYVIHELLLASTYASLQQLWRPDMESKMWMYPVVDAIWSLLFVCIFTKGYEGRGIMEGVRFGVLIGLFTSIPMAFGTYAMMPIPGSLAWQWFIFTLVETILLGIVAAAVYRPREPSAAAGAA